MNRQKRFVAICLMCFDRQPSWLLMGLEEMACPINSELLSIYSITLTFCEMLGYPASDIIKACNKISTQIEN